MCFSPLALYNGWASQEKLWTHAGVKDHIRDAIVLRLRLLLYFYNAFAQYHYHGTPVIRPMQLASGLAISEPHVAGRLDATANPYEIPPAAREVKNQYFFGDSRKRNTPRQHHPRQERHEMELRRGDLDADAGTVMLKAMPRGFLHPQ